MTKISQKIVLLDLPSGAERITLPITIEDDLATLANLDEERKKLCRDIIWKFDANSGHQFHTILTIFSDLIGNTQDAARLISTTTSSYYRWMDSEGQPPRTLVRLGLKAAMLEVLQRSS